MTLNALINLRKALLLMEEDLGLSSLNTNERKVVYTAIELQNNSETITSEKIRLSMGKDNIPHSTYHRVLNNLISKGYLIVLNNSNNRAFRLNL